MDTNRSEKIDDYGEHLSGAHKDRFQNVDVQNVSENDLDAYFDEKGWTKEDLLGAADYAAMVASGKPRDLCLLIKRIRDALPARPRLERIRTEFRDRYARLYVEILNQLKEIFASATTTNDLLRLDLKFIPQMTEIKDGKKYLTRRASEVCNALGGNRGFLAIQVYDHAISEVENFIKTSDWPNKEASAAAPHRPPELKRPIIPNPCRNGVDVRCGKDVDIETFTATFGFRAGQFGNWTSGLDRQNFINQLYDALYDLASVFDLDKSAMSFRGQLAVAFGSRGRAGASAHYEGALKLIHFTKESWLGSVAHEWAHALDHYLVNPCLGRPLGFHETVDEETPFASRIVSGAMYSGRHPLKLAYHRWIELIDSPDNDTGSSFAWLSEQCDRRRKKQYWGSLEEMFARTIESCVAAELSPSRSDWLVSGIENEHYQGLKPYPESWLSLKMQKWFREFFRPAVRGILLGQELVPPAPPPPPAIVPERDRKMPAIVPTPSHPRKVDTDNKATGQFELFSQFG